jgi:hypothetical protein
MNTPIEWQVEELAQTLARQQEKLDLLAAVFGDGPAAAGGRERDTPWTIWGEDIDQLGAPAYDAIGEWVCWLIRTYGSDSPGRSLPACWPDHPGLVAELLTLYHTWRTGFLASRTADAAQTWHGLHLPGFLARVDAYVTRDCHAGRHRRQLPARSICSEHAAAPPVSTLAI